MPNRTKCRLRIPDATDLGLGTLARFSGTVIVYRSKRADRVKVLVWGTIGLVLIWKQLQQGSFRWPPIMDGVVRLTPVEFTALFDGIDWPRVQTIPGFSSRRLQHRIRM